LLGMWLFATIGWLVWLVALASSVTALILFIRMAGRELHGEGRARA